MVAFSSQKIYWLVALIVFAIACASSFHIPNSQFIFIGQDTNWYFSYEFGYNHRGFMGTLFSFFYGDPNHQLIHTHVRIWEERAQFFLLLSIWLMLLFPILMMRDIESNIRLLLFGFACILIFAPIWRLTPTLVGYMDKYVFISAVFALVGLVTRHHLLYLLANIIGFLIHPMMILFSSLFVVFIVYAFLNYPHYRCEMKKWLVVAILPFVISLFLFLIATPEHYITSLEKYNYPDKVLLEQWRLDFLQPGTYNRNKIIGKILIFPWQYVVLVIIFGILPMLLVGLFIRLIQQQKLFHSQYPNKIPLLKKKQQSYLQCFDIYLLFAAAIFIFYPVNYVSVDIQRNLYWSQLGIMMAYIFLLWNRWLHDTPISKNPTNLTKSKKSIDKHNKKIKRNSIFYFVLAYALGGAPLVEIPTGLPLIWDCKRYCISGITVSNPLGEAYTKFVYRSVKATLLPIDIDGRTMQLENWQLKKYIREYEIKNDAILVPPEIKGLVYRSKVSLEEGEAVRVSAHYKSDKVPPLKLLLYGHYLIPPVENTKNRTVWQYAPNGAAHWVMEIHTDGGVPFEFERFIVEHTE